MREAYQMTVIRDAMHCTRARTVLDITHDHVLAAMAAKAAKAATA